MSALQTEVEFTLPKGYVDAQTGTLHKEGVMRLATAADEILPFRDSRVQANAAYLTVILFSRVIVRLGALEVINTKIIEGLLIEDFRYLQELYDHINGDGARSIVCPHCQKTFQWEGPPLGEL